MSEEEQKGFEEEHMNEITEILGDDGVWFNTEVLIAVGKKWVLSMIIIFADLINY